MYVVQPNNNMHIKYQIQGVKANVVQLSSSRFDFWISMYIPFINFKPFFWKVMYPIISALF